MLKLSDYYYDLPEELIARAPLDKRDDSRLMVIDREQGFVKHCHFFDLKDLLKKGDLLVFNNTKVFPARMTGQKLTGGKVEILLNKEISPGVWQVVGKGMKEGASIQFTGSAMNAKVNKKTTDTWEVSFSLVGDDFLEELEKIGQIPIPPYISKNRDQNSKTCDDKERYQTVYAKNLGSVAAPTAGLHFTDELIKELSGLGISFAEITLHVGLGTFQPIKAENVTEHQIHEEYFELSSETLEKIVDAKREGRRIIAVGTTTTRVLEHIFDQNPDILSKNHGKIEFQGTTKIFIYPNFKFKCIDGIITNFHLPKSSLLLLVSAYAGRENIFRSYQKAIKEKYRFYSYGDAMLII